MPFVALDQEGKRVCSLDHEDLRRDYRKGDLLCPACGGAFVYKRGSIVAPHFSHKAECTSDLRRHGESVDHLAGKKHLRDRILQGNKQYGVIVELEVIFPEIKRIADVVADLNGWRTVYEVQLSRIGVEELEERTADYESMEFDVEWWFGRKMNTDAVKEWSIRRTGRFNLIEFDVS